LKKENWFYTMEIILNYKKIKMQLVETYKGFDIYEVWDSFIFCNTWINKKDLDVDNFELSEYKKDLYYNNCSSLYYKNIDDLKKDIKRKITYWKFIEVEKELENLVELELDKQDKAIKNLFENDVEMFENIYL